MSLAFSSLTSKISSTITQVSEQLEAEKEHYLNQRKQKDGTLFTESDTEQPLKRLESMYQSILPSQTNLTPRADSPDDNLWTGVADPEKLKSHIFGLSTEKRNFLTPPPQGTDYTFDMATFSAHAQHMLSIDANLVSMRFNLVPRLIADDVFWRNYFYRVTMLKQQAMLLNDHGSTYPDETSRIQSPLSNPDQSSRVPSPTSVSVAQPAASKSPSNSLVTREIPTDYVLFNADDHEQLADDDDDVVGSDWEKQLQDELQN